MHRPLSIAHAVAGGCLLVALVWLREDFLRAVGGAASLILVTSLVELTAASSSREGTGLTLRYIVFVYLVLALNLLASMPPADAKVGDIWFVSLQFIVLAGVVLCVGVVDCFLPRRTPRSESPRWARMLWARLLILASVPLFSHLLRFVLPIRSWIEGELAAGTLLGLTLLVGVLSVVSTPATGSDASLVRNTGRLFIISVLCVILGFVPEMLRGAWTTWTLSALSVGTVAGTAHMLSRRARLAD